MKVINWVILLLGVFALEVPYPSLAQVQSSASAEALTSDELAVYAAVLNGSPKLGETGRALIADTTSTFACNDSVCNGLLVGGCNGLRGQGESPSDRMAIVERDLEGLQPSTVTSFERVNQKCASINAQIPATAKYYLFHDPEIPKEWKYSFLVYFSRVGFNPEHSQALINVGMFSAMNANDNEGQYFLVTKKDGRWILGGSSAVWKLTP